RATTPPGAENVARKPGRSGKCGLFRTSHFVQSGTTRVMVLPVDVLPGDHVPLLVPQRGSQIAVAELETGKIWVAPPPTTNRERGERDQLPDGIRACIHHGPGPHPPAGRAARRTHRGPLPVRRQEVGPVGLRARGTTRAPEGRPARRPDRRLHPRPPRA